MISIKLKARAKINLTLDVVGKAENGYHLLETVMQTLKLHDVVYLKKISADKIKIKTNLPWVPVDERNLVYAAIDYMRRTYSLKEGIFAELYKRIPVGAGLGGGSADCASAIFAMNKLFGLRLSTAEMLDICRMFGTDIPFCFLRGTALGTGLGDELEILPDAPNFHVVLAKPPVSVSTAHVYKNLVWDKVENHPNTPEFVNAVKSQDRKTIAGGLVNVLETVTLKEQPLAAHLKERLLELGAEGALQSGSGPTVYGLFTDLEAAEKAFRTIKEETSLKDVFLSEFYKNRMGEKNYGQRF
ncbi:MAG: 4-(cytidine 5'-diphospho)-2-C-methyl-D-erythritol kinase [Firmicutes bacterium]|nr:4-(cytidine 5'-diphospho)-2-C-methyl-D-erythritol kinase [Bacillota bacterium]